MQQLPTPKCWSGKRAHGFPSAEPPPYQERWGVLFVHERGLPPSRGLLSWPCLYFSFGQTVNYTMHCHCYVLLLREGQATPQRKCKRCRWPKDNIRPWFCQREGIQIPEHTQVSRVRLWGGREPKKWDIGWRTVGALLSAASAQSTRSTTSRSAPNRSGPANRPSLAKTIRSVGPRTHENVKRTKASPTWIIFPLRP